MPRIVSGGTYYISPLWLVRRDGVLCVKDRIITHWLAVTKKNAYYAGSCFIDRADIHHTREAAEAAGRAHARAIAARIRAEAEVAAGVFDRLGEDVTAP